MRPPPAPADDRAEARAAHRPASLHLLEAVIAEPVLLDHFAVGVQSIDEALARVRRDAGGREVARFTERSWRGAQAAFAGGIRLEALEPIDNPDDDFLVRFLEHNGQGPHHFTFKVPDIENRISRLRGLGIEPVKINLSDPNWQECFLHPKLGLGAVIQLAQPGGIWTAEREPEPADGTLIEAEFLGAELRCSDPATAETVFSRVLDGQAHPAEGGVAYSWPGSGTLVVRPTDGRAMVEAVVFRILSLPPGRDLPERDGLLYDGPTKVLSIGAGEAWPAAEAATDEAPAEPGAAGDLPLESLLP
ncbi:MAG TPA: VOC family protein [Candidatus Solibacter sp.]|nr:VOC family protein [Candidatus Solibacter sp.]